MKLKEHAAVKRLYLSGSLIQTVFWRANVISLNETNSFESGQFLDHYVCDLKFLGSKFSGSLVSFSGVFMEKC